MEAIGIEFVTTQRKMIRLQEMPKASPKILMNENALFLNRLRNVMRR